MGTVAMFGMILSLAILFAVLLLIRRMGKMSTMAMRGFFEGFMLAVMFFALLSMFGALGPYLQGVIGAPFLGLAASISLLIGSWFRKQS